MYNANEEEKKILEFWDADKTFQKSVDERPADKPYAFYDGPPFATGLPHYGHFPSSLMKDLVPRYFTMRGYRVERRWGWDCHGLPIENIIEKELGLNSRREILDYGVDKFNEKCRETVLTYAAEWKHTIKRLGRWVDMENDYKTMDPAFMESVWWVFKQLWDRDLIYKGHKPMHICPRCATTLSNFEVTQGYKDVKDLSVVAKFALKETNQKKMVLGDAPVSVLAWTTTPWTLPGNVLLAVGGVVEYVLAKLTETSEVFVVAKKRVGDIFKDKPHTIVKEFVGKNLVGLEYEPLFSYYAETPNAFRVVTADFVTTDDGTGIVHIAPGYGEDDFNLGAAEGLPLVQHVNMEGQFVKEVTDFAGMVVKPKDDPSKADVEIIKWLAHNGKLFSKLKIEHSYPHCWRCDTPLLNFATTSWFVRVANMKDRLLKNNATINWVPEHIKEGRFGKWLEGSRDWAISRSRYWGTPLPVWQSDDGEVLCVGSIQELEDLSGKKITDLHKHFIDPISITKNGKTYHHIPEVLDCWFESGSMPYGQMHYPFENGDKFEASYPAQFIAEGQDQTRGWFYTLHILATALTSGKNPAIPSTGGSVPAFKNVTVNGIVLAEDGKKMSKKLKNYPDPNLMLEKYGADAMRFYLLSSPVVEAEAINFSEASLRETFSKVVNTLFNVLEFYQLFADGKNSGAVNTKSTHVLDRWILAKLQVLVADVTKNMEAYHLADAARPIGEFITELSQWYVRRSRDRFKDAYKTETSALATLRHVLLELAKVMAPFTPFIAEKVWRTVSSEKGSVHLAAWPEIDETLVDGALLLSMDKIRKIVELGLAARAEAGVKVRQPLLQMWFRSADAEETEALVALEHEFTIIEEEMNVKDTNSFNKDEDGQLQKDGWVLKEDNGVAVALNPTITPELKKLGLVREIVRTLNQLRKDSGFTIEDSAEVTYQTADQDLASVLSEWNEEIMRQTITSKLVAGAGEGKEVEIDGKKVVLSIQKVKM